MAYDFSTLKKDIKETEEWLLRELAGVRTGRATPTLLDAIKPEAYGVRTPLMQLASVSVEDARTLRIIPWDSALLKQIEKAITEADLGVGVAIDAQGLRISFPELTSERRVQLLKIASDKTEQAKVTLRSHRTAALHALDALKEDGGVGEDEITRLRAEVQKLIDAGTGSLLEILKKKETEIAN
ncbi:ribosome recycling factor [Patescibacteria group bacterium]|nr:ribosome recycling factor [Patescibacteria group bacterium]MDE2021690.1 ribosome recycling factor [Patescibacteria group bacterium]MDE2173273.1 ribosome recycling factor [Patescibacteria group bacterium]